VKKSPILFLFIPLLSLLLGSCKEKEEDPPTLTIPESLVVQEGTGTQQKAVITLKLDATTHEQVTVVWSTIDGTALAGEDYIAQLEVTTVFQQGDSEKTIEVVLIQDDVYEDEKEFSVVIGNVKNAYLGKGTCKVTIENDDDYIPDLVIQSRYFVEEGPVGRSAFIIPVRLSGPSDNEVSFSWSTTEGWARMNEDFIPVGEVPVVFAPGETEHNLEVTILNDDIFEMDDYFDIHLVDIQGTTANGDILMRIYIVNDDNVQPEYVADGYITPGTWPGMTLVWSDEFEGPALNTDNWGYDLGGGGWGNNEWQTYTSSPTNSHLAEGKLHITATKLYSTYYSARLLTKGKKEFTYGRIDIRARMPYGQGIWPAIWMLGSNFAQVGWPKCGEIDIMEYLGHIQSQTHGTLHYFKSGNQHIQGTYTLSGGQGFHDAFHVFSIVWQENTIKWYVDYHLFHEVTDAQAAFSAFRLPQFFICNVAVGGNWPGYPDATTVFPQTMEIDYFRVFQVH
jgi:beta-glucanase (GH16 family)